MNDQIIIRPIITEKAMKASDTGKYTLLVNATASKSVIKSTLKSVFKVNAVEIKTVTLTGKRKRSGKKRLEVADASVKKAYVKLGKGQKISAFEPGGEEDKKKKK